MAEHICKPPEQCPACAEDLMLAVFKLSVLNGVNCAMTAIWGSSYTPLEALPIEDSRLRVLLEESVGWI